MKKNIKLIIGIIIAAVLMLLIGILVINSPAQRIKKQLELAERYMQELDYESAIVAYDVAISIDPMNADAYIGKAGAYIEMARLAEDFEKALEYYNEALNTASLGYEKTNDERLSSLIKEINDYIVEASSFHPDDPKQLEQAMVELKQSINELNKLVHCGRAMYDIRSNKSTDELGKIWQPYIDVLEEYLPYCEEEYIAHPGYQILHEVYTMLGKMDDLLRIRDTMYALYGNPHFKTEEYSTEHSTYDKYGLCIKDNSFEYEYEGTKVVKEYIRRNGVVSDYWDYIYDDKGRLSEVYFYGSGGNDKDIITYEGDKIIISRYWLEGYKAGAYDEDMAVYTCDENGRIIHESSNMIVDDVGNDLEPRHEEDYEVTYDLVQ